VGRGGGGQDGRSFQGGFQGGRVSQGPIGGWGGSPKQGGLKAEEDPDMKRPGRRNGVRPLCEIRCKERAGEGKVQDAGAPNERHREPNEHTRGVEEGESEVGGPVEVGGRGGNLVLLEGPEGVGRGVMDIHVTQREGGKGAGGENNVWWNSVSIVGAPFGAVRVDYRETSRGWVKKAVRGEEVQSQNITPSKKTR